MALARSLPATLVFDYPDARGAGAGILIGRWYLLPAQPRTPRATAGAGRNACDAVDAIDEMIDEEIERLFAQKMRRS